MGSSLSVAWCQTKPERYQTNSNTPTKNESTQSDSDLLVQPNSACVRADTSPCFGRRAQIFALCHSACQHTRHPSVPASHTGIVHCDTVIHLVRCETKAMLSSSVSVLKSSFLSLLCVCRLMGLTGSVQTNTCLIWKREMSLSLVEKTATQTLLKCYDDSKQREKVEKASLQGLKQIVEGDPQDTIRVSERTSCLIHPFRCCARRICCVQVIRSQCHGS